MRKGFYFIGTTQYDKDGVSFYGPHLEEGSYENYGKLFIHRNADHQGNPQKWMVAHVASGACCVPNVDLASARLLTKRLQGFKLWDFQTYEEITASIAECNRNPEHTLYEEYNQIMNIRHLRA